MGCVIGCGVVSGSSSRMFVACVCAVETERYFSIYVCCLGLQCSLWTCIVVISNSKEKIDTDDVRRVVMVVEYGLRSK